MSNLFDRGVDTNLSPYSVLNASMGSKFDAFHAGQNPKNTPTNAEKPTATMIDLIEIIVGQFANAVIAFEIPTPDEIPIAPPKTDKTTASVKN